MSGSIFNANQAVGGPLGGFGQGGAIELQGFSTANLSNSLLTNNSAIGGPGGGWGVGGGLNVFVGTVTVENTGFLGNQAIGGAASGAGSQAGPGFGGGVESVGALTLTDCTFGANEAEGGAGADGATGGNGQGGGIESDGGTLTVTSSVILANEAEGGAGGGNGYGGGDLYHGHDDHHRHAGHVQSGRRRQRRRPGDRRRPLHRQRHHDPDRQNRGRSEFRHDLQRQHLRNAIPHNRRYHHVSTSFRSLLSRLSAASPSTGRHRSRRASKRCQPRVGALEARTLLSTLTVTNDNDSGSGSLRGALAAAVAGDTIKFAHSAYGTITLSSGPLQVATSVTIDGPGAKDVTINGNNTFQDLMVDANVTASVSGLTITGGEGPATYPIRGRRDLQRLAP